MTEPVPSWAVSAEQLESWGFALEVNDKCVGMHMVLRPGMTFGAAVHAAWAAGHVRIESMPDHVRAAERAEWEAMQAASPVNAATAIAELKAAGRFVGPNERSQAIQERARARLLTDA